MAATAALPVTTMGLTMKTTFCAVALSALMLAGCQNMSTRENRALTGGALGAAGGAAVGALTGNSAVLGGVAGGAAGAAIGALTAPDEPKYRDRGRYHHERGRRGHWD